MSDRKGRGLSQRLYLVRRPHQSANGEWVYTVKGLTSTYQLCASRGCTCPDFLKRGMCCKHLYFVIHRVLNVPEHEEWPWKDCLLAHVPRGGQPAEVSAIVGLTEASSPPAVVPEEPCLEGDEVCAVCYEEWSATADEPVSTGVCRHQFHRECLRQWLARQTTCPLCRRVWSAFDRGSEKRSEPPHDRKNELS